MSDNPTYVKILRKDMTHHKFLYKEGLNVDTIPFNPTGTCSPGGLYFCTLEDMPLYIEYGTLIADVELPADAAVYAEDHKVKADKIILKNIRPIQDHQCWSDLNFCKLSVQQDGLALQYVKNQTEEICKLAVHQNGLAIQYVKNQTEEIRKLVVQEGGLVFRFC